ncbi:tub-1 [Symbiodinium natans]|uniref:Tub-1 protein n=1 Tax=Symbiodinium natans TaxID=878477 RepID=A0A812VBT6_9DINO|nr:tub-1 [Symbiodinium natans]
MTGQEASPLMPLTPLTSWISSWVGSSASSASNLPDEKVEDEDKWERERAFDIADSLENGLAREIVTEFMHPLRRASKLWKFHVIRSEDKLQYRLFSDDGDFLMYARANLEARQVSFYLYNPCEKVANLFNADKPAFTMSWNADRTEWRIMQERCENCQFSPKHLTCSCYGKQQVAWIRHHRKPVGDGIFNCMEIHVPGLYSDGSRVVWCPLLGRADLSVPVDESYEAQRLLTKQPTWNDEVESLVLDFKGRHILSSAKNFQLALSQKPEHVLCQYGKIGPQTFSLDFKYPLSVVQAFGISLTTLFWT